jgi:hypothetical protein
MESHDRLDLCFNSRIDDGRIGQVLIVVNDLRLSGSEIRLFSPLSPAECASRLEAVIDSERSALFSVAGLFGSRPVVGRVTGSSLRLRKRIGYRNSFQIFLTATMQPEAGGTLISGGFAMHPFVRVFMLIWFGGVILMGGSIFVATVRGTFSVTGGHRQNIWLGLVLPPAMLAFGAGLLRVGRFLDRDEARFLTDFLVETLNARDQKRAA